MLNAKSDGGCELLKKLLASADAFVQSFRPGVSVRSAAGQERRLN